MKVLKNCTLVLPERIVKGYVIIEGQFISEVGLGECPYKGEDLNGDFLVPGYIDLHVHGGAGAGFEVADLHACHRAAEFHLKHGTTSLLMGVEGTLNDLENSLPIKMPENAVGIFMEGPFLSPKRPGAIDPKFLQDPDPVALDDFLKRFGTQISYMAIAPELPEADKLTKVALKNGVVVSAGHTVATIEQLFQAITWGVTSVCHTFNGMPPMHHREPGVVGGALLYDELTTEIICDGFHIHPDVVKLLFKVKPYDKVLAITDSVSLNGMPDGQYGRRVVKGKQITLANGTTIAGSSLTMDQAVKNMVSWGIDLVSVIRSATYNPAKAIGLTDRGSIKKDLKADLLRLDQQLNLVDIYLKGEQISCND